MQLPHKSVLSGTFDKQAFDPASPALPPDDDTGQHHCQQEHAAKGVDLATQGAIQQQIIVQTSQPLHRAHLPGIGLTQVRTDIVVEVAAAFDTIFFQRYIHRAVFPSRRYDIPDGVIAVDFCNRAFQRDAGQRDTFGRCDLVRHEPAVDLGTQYHGGTRDADDEDINTQADTEPQVHLEQEASKACCMRGLDPALPAVHDKYRCR